MGTITTSRMSFEEFERLPDQPGKRELLEGEFIELPPARLCHNRTRHRIDDLVKQALAAAHARGEAAELGEVYMEMGYKLANGSYVQPDVSVTKAGQAEGEYFAGAPAIAVEVVSPANTAQEMETEVDLYFRNGAREVWRVYENTRRAAVHLQGTSRTVPGDASVTTSWLRVWP